MWGGHKPGRGSVVGALRGATQRRGVERLLSTEPQDAATDVVWARRAVLPGLPEGSDHLLCFKDSPSPWREGRENLLDELDELTLQGWMLHDKSLYRVSTTKKGWRASREDCQKRKADLVVINSREELKADASAVSTGGSCSNQTGSESDCRIQKLPRLLVVSADGQLLVYDVDPQEGGECTLAHKHRLFCCDVDSGEETESERSNSNTPPPACPSYAATAALPTAVPVTTTLTADIAEPTPESRRI
ncbi:unnamed protein product [Arctogadus glacialis]